MPNQVRVRGRFALVGAFILLIGVAPAARPLASGPQVGFWASQNFQPCTAGPDPAYCPRDTSYYTPEVWDALADGDASLFLNLVYTSDFGPTPAGKSPRTDGLELVLEANRRGITVNAWITTPLSQGTFANENNTEIMFASVRAMHEWIAEKDVIINEVVVDLEFPLGYQPLDEALNGDLQALMQSNIDPEYSARRSRGFAR